MQEAEVIALAHAGLAVNAPLSDLRAEQLLAGLAPPAGGRALDLGCGWAELLLRLAAAHPSVTGIGIDHSQVSVQRGRRAATERGLAERVHLQVADVREYSGPPAETVLCIGASHAWGGTAPALTAIRPLLRPGGLLLFGEAFWERSPTPAELAALGGREEVPHLLRPGQDAVELVGDAHPRSSSSPGLSTPIRSGLYSVVPRWLWMSRRPLCPPCVPRARARSLPSGRLMSSQTTRTFSSGIP